jgi:hypothetical protein
MAMIKVYEESVSWAVESLANDAIETQDEQQALHAIRMYDCLKAAGYDSCVKHVLPQLARIAHVDL